MKPEPIQAATVLGTPIAAGVGEALGSTDTFALVRASDCSQVVLNQIQTFLDSQDCSHPFQFPVWAANGYFALFLRQRKLCWFAQCGIFYPASRALRSIRALAINRGPVSDDSVVLEEGLSRLVEAAERNGFSIIDIIPEWTGFLAERATNRLVQAGWRPCQTVRLSLRLDLEPELDVLFSRFRKVTRYEIRRSENVKIEITMAHEDAEIECWIELYRRMVKTKQFPGEDTAHMRRIVEWLRGNPMRGGLLMAYKDSELLGGIVIVRCGVRCWYVWGATSKDQRTSVGHLLQWRAIQWAKQAGCHEYDFGGYTEGGKSGTAFFKSGFGGNVVRFSPPYRYIVRPERYRMSEIVDRIRQALQFSAGQ
jgi:hypothetical protein